MHVRHADIVKDPVGVVEREVYPHLGLPHSDRARARQLALVDEMKHSLAKPNRDAACMGLDLEAEVDSHAHIRRYTAEYAVELGLAAPPTIRALVGGEQAPDHAAVLAADFLR